MDRQFYKNLWRILFYGIVAAAACAAAVGFYTLAEYAFRTSVQLGWIILAGGVGIVIGFLSWESNDST